MAGERHQRTRHRRVGTDLEYPRSHATRPRRILCETRVSAGCVAMKNVKSNKKELSPEQRDELLRALKARFEKNKDRHKGLEWPKVQAKLEANTEKLWSLHEMERTGGE